MKITLLLISISFGLSLAAFADPCDTDTLTDYVADGSCTIGDLTFSGFSLLSSQGLGGGLAPQSDDITVSPFSSGGETGLIFTSLWLAGTGQLVDSSITYTVATSNPGGITDADLRIVGGAAGNGVASAAETSFAPPLSLFTEFGPGPGGTETVIPEDSTTFAPVGSLTLTKDIGVSGGTVAGGAHISDVYNLFSETSTVPEPSLLILCTGLLGLVPVARRKFVR